MTEASSSPKEISFINKRIIKKDKMANLGAMEDDNGTVLDPISSMKYIADTHFVDSVPIDPDHDRRRNKTIIVEDEEVQQPSPTQGRGGRTNKFINPLNYVDTPDDEVVDIDDPKVAFITPNGSATP